MTNTFYLFIPSFSYSRSSSNFLASLSHFFSFDHNKSHSISEHFSSASHSISYIPRRQFPWSQRSSSIDSPRISLLVSGAEGLRGQNWEGPRQGIPSSKSFIFIPICLCAPALLWTCAFGGLMAPGMSQGVRAGYYWGSPSCCCLCIPLWV